MIKLFAMDVDGTLTDGGVYMDSVGGEMKRFDAQDGQGIALLLQSGVKVLFISGRYSAPTQRRAGDLKITRCLNGVSDKLTELQKFASEFGLSAEEIAYVGDDLPDIEPIRWAGLGFAVANARPQVLEAAERVTSACGGRGAVRECADIILKINDGKSAV